MGNATIIDNVLHTLFNADDRGVSHQTVTPHE
jgi:hypothetical protein